MVHPSRCLEFARREERKPASESLEGGKEESPRQDGVLQSREILVKQVRTLTGTLPPISAARPIPSVLARDKV